MRELFPHRLLNHNLFCRRCQNVMVHGLFAREQYSTIGGMDPRIPLLCICDTCKAMHVAFSQDFSFCRQPAGLEYAKIHGRNRIVPGNWIYFKGTQKPGLVKSHFQAADKEIVGVSYDGGQEQQVELPCVNISQEEAPLGYRLLPAQSAQALIGDHIYHAIRDEFGVVVGRVNDGEKDKLAVQLANGTLLFISLPAAAQNLPNQVLGERVHAKLWQFFPHDVKQVLLEVGQGIVYLKGIVGSLPARRALKGCVEGIPKVRGCVDLLRVGSDTGISDQAIANAILNVLDSPQWHVFDYSVLVNNGKADVSVHYFEGRMPKEVENRITEIKGLQDLNFSANLVESDSMPNFARCQELEEILRQSPHLQNTVIRVSFVQNKYVLEGYVHSSFQRHRAYISAMTKLKSPVIENKIRIIS